MGHNATPKGRSRVGGPYSSHFGCATMTTVFEGTRGYERVHAKQLFLWFRLRRRVTDAGQVDRMRRADVVIAHAKLPKYFSNRYCKERLEGKLHSRREHHEYKREVELRQ